MQLGSVEVSEAVFDRSYNEGLIHQVVTSYMTNARQGTKAQKTRSEVRGGGRKPWRQKGTGSARAGTTRSPIWVGGGRAFAARSGKKENARQFSPKVNRKMYTAAVSSILSELNRQERLLVVDDFSVAEPKTKLVVAALKKASFDEGSILIVTKEQDDTLMMAARNLPNVDVFSASQLTPVVLVAFDRIVMTKNAVKHVEEWLS